MILKVTLWVLWLFYVTKSIIFLIYMKIERVKISALKFVLYAFGYRKVLLLKDRNRKGINMKFVSIIMGSKSDYNVMKSCADTLDTFGVPYELIISSAHRSPERTKQYVMEAEQKGAQCFIAAAGMAAHLAGALAATTVKPIIGVPMGGSDLSGVDALYSTVQMPAGMPVATVAIGKAGAVNSAYLAMQILALDDAKLSEKLQEDRKAKAKKVETDSAEIETIL